MFFRATEAIELLLVFPLMILGILITHWIQKWADRTSQTDE